jgi:hypothetical protein
VPNPHDSDFALSYWSEDDRSDDPALAEFTDIAELQPLLAGIKIRLGSLTCGRSDGLTLIPWWCEFDVRGAELPQFPYTSFTVGVMRPPAWRRLPPTFQRDFVEVLIAVATELNAVTGYVTLDEAATSNPYGLWYGVPELKADMGSREALLGYYWGNFLSDSHITALGGWDAVRREAPVYRAEGIDEEKGLFYLQLTEDIEDVTDDELRSLEQYLRPVLHSGHPGYRYPGFERFRLVD